MQGCRPPTTRCGVSALHQQPDGGNQGRHYEIPVFLFFVSVLCPLIVGAGGLRTLLVPFPPSVARPRQRFFQRKGPIPIRPRQGFQRVGSAAPRIVHQPRDFRFLMRLHRDEELMILILLCDGGATTSEDDENILGRVSSVYYCNERICFVPYNNNYYSSSCCCCCCTGRSRRVVVVVLERGGRDTYRFVVRRIHVLGNRTMVGKRSATTVGSRTQQRDHGLSVGFGTQPFFRWVRVQSVCGRKRFRSFGCRI